MSRKAVGHNPHVAELEKIDTHGHMELDQRLLNWKL